MGVSTYPLGQMVRITASYKNQSGAATDPDLVTFEIGKPDGTVLRYSWTTSESDPELVRDGTGEFHTVLEPDISGDWWYRTAGTGAVTAVREHSFNVARRKVAAA
jgi:uncharacterized protein YfaS (alpha-2-macroglobulin family)